MPYGGGYYYGSEYPTIGGGEWWRNEPQETWPNVTVPEEEQYTPADQGGLSHIRYKGYGQGARPNLWTGWPSDIPWYSGAGRWFRDPSHPAHLVWNPYLGWQNYAQVLEQMKSGKPYQEWGMEAHPEWWQNYDISQWGLDPNKFGGGAGAGEGELGWFEFTPEMQAYMNKLLARGQEFLDMPVGYTPEMIANWFGKDFDLIRQTERPLRESTMETLAREGQLGTGATTEAMNKIAWNVEGKVADIARDIFIQSEMQKKQDMMDFTNMAQSIFGTGVGYEQLIEAINAARRGERQGAMDDLLALLGMLTWR